MLKIDSDYSGGIIDAHVHLDDRNGVSAAVAARDLASQMKDSGIGHAVALHLLWQPWSVEEFASAIAGHEEITGFVNIDPLCSAALNDLERGRNLGFSGVKLHPRMQKYRPDDARCVALVRAAGELGMPVLLDCFPDGDWLLSGLSLLQYANLARQSPRTTIIVAHAAGHHCLDLLMIAKRVPNMWMDISYSLLYYESPVVDALFYLMKSMRYERVMFGTDFPDRSLRVSVDRSLELFDRFAVESDAAEKILWKNAVTMLRYHRE